MGWGLLVSRGMGPEKVSVTGIEVEFEVNSVDSEEVKVSNVLDESKGMKSGSIKALGVMAAAVGEDSLNDMETTNELI